MELTEQLKRKFLKDFNLSYSITKEPYFSNAIQVLGYEKQLLMFQKFISKFSNVEELYDSMDSIFGNKSKDGKLIEYIKQNPLYTTVFQDTAFYNDFLLPNAKYNKISNLYSNNNVGKIYISIDLKEANFQMFKLFKIIKTNNYKEFIRLFTNEEYFWNTKQARQIVFGQLNPKRQQKYQRYVMLRLYDLLVANFKAYYFTSDELLCEIEYNDTSQIIIDINELIINDKTLNTLDFHINTFELKVLKTESGFYYYKHYDTKPNKPKGVSKSEYLEVYKLINDIPVTDLDLYTIINTGETKRVAKLEPLQIIK